MAITLDKQARIDYQHPRTDWYRDCI